ncbi:DNA polymerase III subunit delta [Alkalibacter rhizosphaerae]|uniref:DNA polymerase III subunit delta n=1 Tax=Alkalibacter rhizosphaerae TaxID=2815577 RepID=A0A974XEF2_9FIRM|nr:DNA polymerase III subunit delta [Alkalibacter rhizosphaerae]QSX08339.1 DNA polymerase III subunit delta [Alkalibacter rhizosphaerae]
MKYQELNANIKENKIAKVYLLCGEEYQISKMMAGNLKTHLIDPAFEQLNYIRFDEKTHTVQDIVAFSETMPFMSEKRMVLVAEGNLLHGSIPDQDADTLIQYIKTPNDATCLVFLSRKIDKKRKLTKALLEHGVVVETNRVDRIQLEKWIAKRIRVAGKKVDRLAMNALVEGLEYLDKDSKMNLEDVDNELEKIIAYAGERVQIESEDVAVVLSRGVEHSIFRMVDFLGTGKVKESLEILDYLFEVGEHPTKILFMMVRQLRILYRSKLLKERGYTTEHIASTTGFRPFMINNALRQGRNFSLEKLKKAYERCADIDRLLKSTKNDPKVLLEMLIFDLR